MKVIRVDVFLSPKVLIYIFQYLKLYSFFTSSNWIAPSIYIVGNFSFPDINWYTYSFIPLILFALILSSLKIFSKTVDNYTQNCGSIQLLVITNYVHSLSIDSSLSMRFNHYLISYCVTSIIEVLIYTHIVGIIIIPTTYQAPKFSIHFQLFDCDNIIIYLLQTFKYVYPHQMLMYLNWSHLKFKILVACNLFVPSQSQG